MAATPGGKCPNDQAALLDRDAGGCRRVVAFGTEWWRGIRLRTALCKLCRGGHHGTGLPRPHQSIRRPRQRRQGWYLVRRSNMPRSPNVDDQFGTHTVEYGWLAGS